MKIAKIYQSTIIFPRTASNSIFCIFFPTKRLFTMVPTNSRIHNNKTRKKHLRQDLIVGFIDKMRQTLKYKQGKQNFYTLYYNNISIVH